MNELQDLTVIMDTGIPLVVIDTYEEPRVLELATRLAMKSARKLYRWSATDGLVDNASTHQVAVPKLPDPETLLHSIRQRSEGGIYVLCDIHPYLSDPKIVRLIKDLALYQRAPVTLILVSYRLSLPDELRQYSVDFTLQLPNEDQVRHLVLEEARRWQRENTGLRVKTDAKTLNRLVANLQGLSRSDVQRLARGAIYDDGAITDTDLPEVNKAKFALMDMQNILHFEYDTARFSDVGGLRHLKRWLGERKAAFIDSGMAAEDQPKGVMLLGVQGGGKSLAAKAVAGLWDVPLLRLDMGSLYNKFYGETERNLRDTLALADNIAPCVLWIDEIEKAIAQDDNEGISQRLLGTFLTWMAERKSRVFIVATSNNIAKLPPELIRKGRLDEVFFIDLPDQDTRRAIASIHLKKRDITLSDDAIDQIAQAALDFTGAEIEQAIVAAMYRSRARDEAIELSSILYCIEQTSPIAVTRAEDIAALRLWAKDRTVMAD